MAEGAAIAFHVDGRLIVCLKYTCRV